MAATIKDIAQLCGVSYSTVSRALNDYPLTSRETKQKVLEAARTLGYTPNDVARKLVTRTSDMVGLLVPDISNPYFPDMAKGVTDVLDEAGFHVFLCNVGWKHENERRYRDILIEKRVAGMIVAPGSDKSGELFEDTRIPTVFVGSKTASQSSNYVSVDNKKGASLAVEYLLRLGHQKIACVQAKTLNISGHERLCGFKATLEASGVFIPDEYIVTSGKYNLTGGYEASLRLLQLNDPPTAIVAFEDILALGVIEAIGKMGKLVPDDISVIGFDDIIFSELPKINLTSVFQPKYKAGAVAAEILLDKIAKLDDNTPVQVILEPELVVRGTCAAMRSCP